MPRRLDIDLLRSFVAICEARTLGRAAAKVGRTQAALSMQVQKLEALLDQALLVRSGRGVSPTPHGERLLAHAHALLRHHDTALADLCGGGLAGTVCFGCPEDYAAAFLPVLLRDFAQRHPQVFLEVVCAPTPRLEERLRRHAIDLALVSVADDRDPQVMRREALVWVGNGHDDLTREPVLPLALGDPDTLDHRAARAQLAAQGRAYRIAYAAGSMAGLLAVVRSGQAIAVLTQSAVPDDLRVLAPGEGLPSLPSVGLVVRMARARRPAVVDEFASHLRQRVPAL